jgi:predicted transglutaminase-like cysteine proteinase
LETIARRAGDCEDHAILKMAFLLYAGVKCHLAIVKIRGTGQGHALCAVPKPWRFLDCRRADILTDAEAGARYAPLYLLDPTTTLVTLETKERAT